MSDPSDNPTLNKRSIGQLFAALSVVLSLIFVGYEIRQNTAVARNEAYQQMVGLHTEFLMGLSTDDRLAQLWNGVQDRAPYESFDPEERRRINYTYIALLRVWEGVFRSVQQDILPQELLPTIGAGGAFTTPYFQEVWPNLRPNFTEDSSGFLEGSAMLGDSPRF